MARLLPLLLFGFALEARLEAQARAAGPLDVLEEELKRNFEALKAKGDPPPYFVSYALTDTEGEAVSASFGALEQSGGSRARFLDVSVRIGSPKLDNYRIIRGERPRFANAVGVPVEGSLAALRRRAWLETDRVYRTALQRMIAMNSQREVIVKEAAVVADFSVESPQKAVEPVPTLKIDRAAWEAKARQWSALFNGKPGVLASRVTIAAQREVKRFVSTEGARLEHGRTFARVTVSAQGKAPDGMDVSANESFEASEPGKLPDDKIVAQAIEKVSANLAGLLRAPVVEPYVGPAILSGRSAGVFFHEIFGHRIEGHRQKDETEGQTFAKSVGTPILPDFLSVTFDATRKQMAGMDLFGWYSFDDEGVRASSVKLVDGGVLKTFLLSRSPIEGFPNSNGHGRKQPGAEVVSRQSNLIVESSKQTTAPQLREMLIAEARRQNKPYGLYFEQVTGGFTTTGRRGLQAFTVIPLIVYRVWADGRPDELVRGADIVGTPLASFAKIMATGDKPEVFNGYCGAESGTVPVSAVSPAILVSEIEIQKKERSQDRPPFLERPESSRPDTKGTGQ
ncbi:MAG: metallopeptidase TldD-related protein [Bryobacteraceae bacterium]|nr:metallopeptidase TldD-related protein [Bryobacteraceae bacterium]